MATITPTTPTHADVIATAALARGDVSVTTRDWRTKWKGIMNVRLGRTGTAALTNGVACIIRPAPNNNAYGHPGPVWQAQSLTAAANSTTVDTDSNSGQKTLQVAAITGYAAGDVIIIGGGTAREEWARVSKTVSGTVDLVLDRDLQFTHTAAQADTVRNKGDAWTVELPGSCVWEVVLDYGDDAAGDSVRVHVSEETVDSVTST